MTSTDNKTDRQIPLRVTQASLNQTAFDFPRNLANIYTAIDEAVKQESDLLCFEELTLTGYDAGDDFQKTDNAVIAEMLQDIAHYAYRKNPNLVISIGHPYYYADKAVALPASADKTERHTLESEQRKNTLFNRINLPFNVQSFIGQGRILGMTAKSYLFGYDRGYEKRYFGEWSAREANEAGGKFGTISIAVPGQSQPVPFGRPLLQLASTEGAVMLSHVICEEKWEGSRYDHPGDTDADYDRHGVAPAIAREAGRDGLILVIPNASPPSPLRIDKHVHLAKLASHYADAVIDTDGLGSSGATFAQFGHRLIIQDGNLTVYGKRLSFARVAVDTNNLAVTPADSGLAGAAHAIIAHRFAAGSSDNGNASAYENAGWDNPSNPGREVEEGMRMACLWLFDYMRKTKSQGITEALSGGADSAFNSVIVVAMVRLAVAELGIPGFCREMKHLRYREKILEAFEASGQEAAIQACLENMLAAVYMGTDNSSEDTRRAAEFLVRGGSHEEVTVKGIGGSYRERNVQDLLDFYAMTYAVKDTSAIAPERKIKLQADLAAYLNLRPGSVTRNELWQKADALRAAYPEIEREIISAADPRHALTYENLQARARQVAIMEIANAEGKMSIANPNLDEARNAYATFGGDLHAGTINLNAFINKSKQLAYMRYLQERGLEGIEPVKSLALILGNKPSAELQPKDEHGRVIQNDVDALQRDFDQMNIISIRMLAERTGQNKERRLNPSEVFDACREDPAFAGVDDGQLYNMVRFSYYRWGIAQHKIHASPIAPTFGSSVDHQTSLRTPNLNGWDRAELTQLGVKLLFSMAKKETTGPAQGLLGQDQKTWLKRALMDERFVDGFEIELRRENKPDLEFDLGSLYRRARNTGLAGLFGPISPFYADLTPQPG